MSKVIKGEHLPRPLNSDCSDDLYAVMRCVYVYKHMYMYVYTCPCASGMACVGMYGGGYWLLNFVTKESVCSFALLREYVCLCFVNMVT